MDLLNKQNTETRRTNQFLRFALGVRSPERKSYFRSKLFTAPQDARLKLDGTDLPAASNNAPSRTMYNKGFNSFQKLDVGGPRAQTSKVAGKNCECDGLIEDSPAKENTGGNRPRRGEDIKFPAINRP